MGTLARLARGAGIGLISVDVGSPLAMLLIDARVPPPVPVSSIWLGDPWRGVGTGPRHRQRLGAWVRHADPPLVALDLERLSGGGRKATDLITRIEQARQLVGRERRLLLALRGWHLLGGRRHLAELTALRHLAEEWDFGFAIDLAAGLEPTWEAEAAILRLGGHLRLLRIKTGATHRLAVGEARVAARALAAAMEQPLPPEVALVPSVPLVLAGSLRAKTEATAAAASTIKSRAARVSTERAQFLNYDLWPRLRG